MPMTLLDRKAELVRRGTGVQHIASRLGLTYQHVRAVLREERRSPRVEAAIAEAIGQPVDEVFPVAATSAAA